MFTKTVIVLAALFAYQGAFSFPKDIQDDILKAAGVYHESVTSAIRAGSDKLNGVLNEVAVSTAATEDYSIKKIDESVALAKRQIDAILEKASQEGVDAKACWQSSMYSLDTLIDITTNDVRNCGWNFRQEMQSVSREILSKLSWEFYYEQQGFHSNYQSCIAQESSKCLDQLLTRIYSETADFPQEVALRINESIDAIRNIEKGVANCVKRTDYYAANQSVKITEQMQICIA